jgi:hypothetical protein
VIEAGALATGKPRSLWDATAIAEEMKG